YLCLLRAQATTTALYARSLHDALPISGRVEPLGVHRWHRAAGRAEQHQGAPGAQAGQAGVEGALADPVVDHVDPAAVGEVADLLGDVGFGVADDLVGTGFPGQPLARKSV